LGAAHGAVVACAVSAGVHAGLVPEHLQTEPREGVAFIVAAVLLFTVAGGLTAQPDNPYLAGIAALLFAGLICAYVATRTHGIPWLAPDRESLDTVGVATNVVEAVGLVLALHRLLQPPGAPHQRQTPQEVTR
jgi:hypothetical protein